MTYPDAEVALVSLLSDLGTTGTEAPADLQQRLPFIRVRRFAGSDDGLTDHPSVSVDVFGPTRTVAFPLAEQIRQRLTAGYHVVGGEVLDRIATLTGPVELPWGGDGVRRWSATYRVSARRLT